MNCFGQRPILLKGHTRPLTHVKYNRESDLIFTTAKDHSPCVWYASNGERLGTFDGHNGSVWCVDVSFHTTRLLTGASDTHAKLWDVQTGKELFTFPHKSVVRSVAFSIGEKMMLSVQDQSFSQQPTIFIYNLADDINERTCVLLFLFLRMVSYCSRDRSVVLVSAELF